jgi:hypothetical protein
MMRMKKWMILFIIFGLYGTIGEIVINSVMTLIRGNPLWIYYNGFSTSWESLILFGLFGCLGFKIYLLLRNKI